MKRIIFAAFVLASVLSFGGCTKDNTDTMSNNAAAYGTAGKMLPPSIVTYQMMIDPPVSIASFQWSSGYMTTSALFFEGTPQIGDTTDLQKFETDNTATVKLFEPTVLGSVGVAIGLFDYGSYLLRLDPSKVNPCLALTGTYNLNGNLTPVQVTVNDQVLLNTRWMSNVLIQYKYNYVATLHLGMGALTYGISDEMMASAEKTNGTVMISNAVNPKLYQIILSNLQTNILEVSLSGYSQTLINPNTANPLPVTPSRS